MITVCRFREAPPHAPAPACGCDVEPWLPDVGPLEAWIRLEDLWLRWHAAATLSVSAESEAIDVVLHGFGASTTGPLAALVPHMVDAATCRWHAGSGSGTLMRLFERRGDHLVFGLNDLRRMSRWLDGDCLVAQIRDFLRRMPQATREPSCDGTAPTP